MARAGQVEQRMRAVRRRVGRIGDARVRRAALITATALLSCLCAAPAGAIVVRSGSGRMLSYSPTPGLAPRVSPFDSIFHNVDYNGGEVMPSNTNYTFYWQPAGAPSFPSDYQPGIDRFFADLAHDSGGSQNVESILTQYNDATGHHAGYESHFAGAILDTHPYPANGCQQAAICLTDAQIRFELAAYINAHKLPGGLSHEYFVIAPPGVESCFEAAGELCSAASARPEFCAYHGAIPRPGGPIIYADIPYLQGTVCDDGNHPNGASSDAAISGGLSHEHDESLSDPEPNGAWTDWASGASTGYEVADKCRTFSAESEDGPPLGTAPDGAAYNQLINGHSYWLQQEWSNQGHACMQRLSFVGPEPTASFTVQSGEQEATFDASASTASGGVAHYEWQPGGPGGGTPIQTTSPVLKWKFPSPGVYDVALTVFAADGTGSGTARTAVLGDLPSVTRVAPAKGPVGGGTSVTISGANFDRETSAVDFGAGGATFTVASASRIIALAPPGSAGVTDITVLNGFGRSQTTTADRFHYLPVVTRVSPLGGPAAGATSVTVTGSGFAPGTAKTAIRFGTSAAKGVTCASSTTCTATAPAHPAGPVDVKAAVKEAASAATPADVFTYR